MRLRVGAECGVVGLAHARPVDHFQWAFELYWTGPADDNAAAAAIAVAAAAGGDVAGAVNVADVAVVVV